MKVTVDPGSKSTFSMVCERTADMVSHTMMVNGVSLFLLGIVAVFFFELWSASPLVSNTGKASSVVDLLVGIVLLMSLCMDLDKGGAFPAVKVRGLLFSINPLIFLVLFRFDFLTVGAAHQILRGSPFNASSHNASMFL